MNTPYAEVAGLHRSAINKGFMSSLGVGFLSHFYRAIDETAGGVLVVEKRNGQVVGFASGATSVTDVYRRLAARRWRVALSIVPAISPSMLLKLAESYRYGATRHSGTEAFPTAELLSIAVKPEYRGKGVAESLFKALCLRFRDLGVSEFKIMVGRELVGAQKFYARMGAVAVAETEVHRGERSVIFRYGSADKFDSA